MSITKMWELRMSWDADNVEDLEKISAALKSLKDTGVNSMEFERGNSCCRPCLVGYFSTVHKATVFHGKAHRAILRNNGTIH
jgi:hypothetical protein